MIADLHVLARALNGEVVGGQVSCPGPGHSPRDRSLSVRVSAQAPMGFIAFSHCGDNWQACRDYVAGRLGFGRDDWKRDRPSLERARPAPAPVDNSGKVREALEYWNASVDPRPTVVRTYLSSRGLDLPDDVAGSVIRFNARIGAMVSLFRNILTGEPQAVLRTYLNRDGRKRTIFDQDGKELGERLFKGPTGGAAIMLDPIDAVTAGLHIGEGAETALAARQLGLKPVWALGSKGAIATFPVLLAVESLTILAEPDAEREIEACASRWHAAGRQVLINRPIGGKDLNDAIRGAA